MRAFARLRAWLAARGGGAPYANGPRLRDGVVAIARRERVALDSAASLSAEHGFASLSRALRHADPTMRARAVAVVAELVDAGSGTLLKTMIHDPSAEVRCAVARAAARVGTTEVIGSLIVALADPDARVRAEAAKTVSRVTGCRVTSTAAAVNAGEIEAVKRWWREKRFSELLDSVQPTRRPAEAR